MNGSSERGSIIYLEGVTVDFEDVAVDTDYAGG